MNRESRVRALVRVTLVCLVGTFVAAGACPRSDAQTYGYVKEEDPLLLGAKKVIALARERDFRGVRKAVDSLEWQVDELKRDVGVDLEAVLDEAVASENPTRIAYAITHLVFQAMRQKFHWNEREKLANTVNARARLDSARFYYDEILSHAVRRADRAEEKTRHREISAALREMRETIGSPGLFGVGGKKSDPDAFANLARGIERRLHEVYPDFVWPDPKKKPSKPSDGSGENEKRGGRG